MIYFITAYSRILLQQLCIAPRLRTMYTKCRLVLSAEEHNIPCFSAGFLHFYASRFRIIIFCYELCSVFAVPPQILSIMQPYFPLILRALFSTSYSSYLRISPEKCASSSLHHSKNRFPPFLHKLQNLRLIGIILKRPVLLPPKTARTSHEIRTAFLHGPLPKPFHFRSISNGKNDLPPISARF